MKQNYINPGEWIEDIDTAINNPRLQQKRMEVVTNEYVGDTVLTDGVVPEDTGDLKRDVQRKSVPKNGLVMTNLPYSGYANAHNTTGVEDYLEEMWKVQLQVYRDIYSDLLLNDLNNQ